MLDNPQKVYDMLVAMQQQRDQAMNANVLAQADIASRDREIATLRRTLAERDSAIKQVGEEVERLRAERSMPPMENLPSNPYANGAQEGATVQ
jgi:predicted RNase H-like nuclease (RuvC/YqgF family)